MNPGEILDHKYLAAYFDTKVESQNFLKYQSSKFYQLLVKSNTTSHAGSAKIHNIVPDLEDYTMNNDLFKTDDELDKYHKYYGLDLDHRLYKLFELTDEEIKIIEDSSLK